MQTSPSHERDTSHNHSRLTDFARVVIAFSLGASLGLYTGRNQSQEANALLDRAPITAEAGFETFNQSIQGTVDYIMGESFNPNTSAELLEETNGHGEVIKHFRISNHRGGSGLELRTTDIEIDGKMETIDYEIIDSESLVLPGVNSYISFAFHDPIEGEAAWTVHTVINAGDGTAQQHPLLPTLEAAQSIHSTVSDLVIAGLLNR